MSKQYYRFPKWTTGKLKWKWTYENEEQSNKEITQTDKAGLKKKASKHL